MYDHAIVHLLQRTIPGKERDNNERNDQRAGDRREERGDDMIPRHLRRASRSGNRDLRSQTATEAVRRVSARNVVFIETAKAIPKVSPAANKRRGCGLSAVNIARVISHNAAHKTSGRYSPVLK